MRRWKLNRPPLNIYTSFSFNSQQQQSSPSRIMSISQLASGQTESWNVLLLSNSRIDTINSILICESGSAYGAVKRWRLRWVLRTEVFICNLIEKVGAEKNGEHVSFSCIMGYEKSGPCWSSSSEAKNWSKNLKESKPHSQKCYTTIRSLIYYNW